MPSMLRLAGTVSSHTLSAATLTPTSSSPCSSELQASPLQVRTAAASHNRRSLACSIACPPTLRAHARAARPSLLVFSKRLNRAGTGASHTSAGSFMPAAHPVAIVGELGARWQPQQFMFRDALARPRERPSAADVVSDTCAHDADETRSSRACRATSVPQPPLASVRDFELIATRSPLCARRAYAAA